MALDKLLIQLRAMQLFYHNCHNVTKGPSFMSDHNLFGDFYGKAEGDYDGCAERFIGLAGSDAFDGIKIAASATTLLSQLPKTSEPADMWKIGLGLEQSLVKLCEACDKDPKYSSGTRQLVGDIANFSEGRIYKIKQRIK